MKKSNFLALVLGTISGVLFALGMCMALIPEWNSLRPGIVFGCVGIFLGVVTLLVWRRMEGCAPIQISGKALLAAAVAIVGALTLGSGMCFCMVWGKMIPGIFIGLVGILILLALIPLTRGLHD